MLFTSFEFLFFFLPVVLACNGALKSFEHRIAFLSLASLGFYAYGSGLQALGLILVLIVFNFAMGLVLARWKSGFLLAIGVIINLLPLVHFKYSAFLFTALSISIPREFSATFLPLAISFYTFEQIAYLIDIYRGRSHERKFLHYAFFAINFPRLVAGPILRYWQLEPQLHEGANKNAILLEGLLLLLIGLAKKLIIADNLAPIANPVFDGAGPVSFDAAVSATIAYSLQIYFDFSAYSDIAIGLGCLTGFRIPVNFDSPYQATSLIDFWKRWHISLSSWFRDYLYIPLGGNRHGRFRRHANILATMLVCGLWHGASWAFVLWGGLHGVLVVANHAKRRMFPDLGMPWLAWLATFIAVCLLWVPFRAPSAARAFDIYQGLVTFGSVHWKPEFRWIALGLILIPFPNSQRLASLAFTRLLLPVKDYFTGLQRRLVIYSGLLCLIIVVFMAGFYGRRWDAVAYRYVPCESEIGRVETQFGDYRSNFLINELWRHDGPKIVVVGSSFTVIKDIIFPVETPSRRYLFSSAANGGNGLLNGLRAALAASEMPGVEVIIFGVSPVNMGERFLDGPFLDQGADLLRLIGVTPPEPPRTLSGFLPVKLDGLMLADMAVNYRDKRYFQFRNFLQRLSSRREASSALQMGEVVGLTVSANSKLMADLEAQIAEARQKPIQVPQVALGSDEQFHWQDRGIFQSMQPGGNVDRAMGALKRYLEAKGIRLVLYHSPAPSHAEAPQIYPAGFLEQFETEMAAMVTRSGIEYYDLSRLFPWDGRFMQDFVHPGLWPRVIMYRVLLARMFSAKN